MCSTMGSIQPPIRPHPLHPLRHLRLFPHQLRHHTHTGAIIGGSVGGALFLVGGALSAFLFLRRRRCARNANMRIASSMAQVTGLSHADEYTPYPQDIRPHNAFTGVRGKIGREQARTYNDNPEDLGTEQTSELPPSSSAVVNQQQTDLGQGDVRVVGQWSDIAWRLETLIMATEINRQRLHEAPPSYDRVGRNN